MKNLRHFRLELLQGATLSPLVYAERKAIQRKLLDWCKVQNVIPTPALLAEVPPELSRMAESSSLLKILEGARHAVP